MQKLIIGTRGSKLALVQTKLVAEALQQIHPELIIENKIITTKGDLNQSPIPLDIIGKAWFTEEINQALLANKIDLAVHSLKDLPPDLPSNLKTIVVLNRADAADVLISKSGLRLKDLPRHAIIGTDSARRKALLLAIRPDLVIKSIRGNIDIRLKKLESENYDAIVIAMAGLMRLNIIDRATERFDPVSFVPSPGQGTLVAQIKSERTEILDLLTKIVHTPTATVAEIEQIFSSTIGGGCKLPIGCYAEINGEKVSIYAVVGKINGNHITLKSKNGLLLDGKKLAKELAKEF